MFLGIGYVKLSTKNYDKTLAMFKHAGTVKVLHEDEDGVVFEFKNGDLLEVIRSQKESDLKSDLGLLVQDIDDVVEKLALNPDHKTAVAVDEEFPTMVSVTGSDACAYRLMLSEQSYPDTSETHKILFYGPHSKNGYLGNWYLASLYLKGVIWPTSEHYYQAQKFIHPEDEELCRRLQTPREAFEMTRRDDIEIRSDWDDVKVDVMRDAVYAKFSQNPDLMERLLATGDAELVENSPVDYFWGIGKDGSGKNVLGQILMEVRDQLKASK